MERIGRTSHNIPSGKAPKSLKTVKWSAPIDFVISRSCVRVTPPAPKKHRKPKLSMLFLLQKLCACEKVYADTHNNNKIYERDDGSNKQVSAWERVRSITVGARAAHFLPCASQCSSVCAARGIADDIVRHHQQEREKGEAKQQRQFELKRLGEREENNFKIRQQLIEKQPER